MVESFYDVLNTAVYVAGAATVLITVGRGAFFYWRKRVETDPARLAAQKDFEKARGDEYLRVLNDAGYKERLQLRKDLATELITQDKELAKSGDDLKRTLDGIVGTLRD